MGAFTGVITCLSGHADAVGPDKRAAAVLACFSNCAPAPTGVGVTSYAERL